MTALCLGRCRKHAFLLACSGAGLGWKFGVEGHCKSTILNSDKGLLRRIDSEERSNDIIEPPILIVD
jgi:hypothetical protein